MALQGNLYKLVVNNFKTILNLNRTQVNQQQYASLKQSAKEKLADLNLPEKPKKPLTPYFRYMQEHRGEVIAQNPNMKLTEVTKQCAIDWVKVHASIKEKYSNEYRKDMEGYTKLVLDYDAQLTNQQKDGLKSINLEKRESKKRRELRKQFKETDKPKRPIGPYMQYVIDVSKQRGQKLTETLQAIKGKWQTLPISEKEIYSKRFEEDKQRYEKEMAAWEAKMVREGRTALVRNSSLNEAKPVKATRARKD